jgi:hypothetical protein
MLLGFGELSANIEDSLRVKSNTDFYNSLPVLTGEDYVSPIFSQNNSSETLAENDPAWLDQKAEVEKKLKEYFGGMGNSDIQKLEKVAGQRGVPANKVYANPAYMPPPPPDPISASTMGTFLDDEIALIQKARGALKKIRDGAKWIQRLDGGNLISLPVGISFGGNEEEPAEEGETEGEEEETEGEETEEETEETEESESEEESETEEEEESGGSTKYTLAVVSMKIYPTYTALEIFVEIDGPNMDAPLIFYAPSIKFTREGGLSGVISIGLLGNAAINVFDQKAVLVLKRGVPQIETDAAGNVMNVSFVSGTFINFGCDDTGEQKFLGMGLDLEFHFSRDWVKPVPPPLEPGQDPPTEEPTDRVVATFTGSATDFDDILIDNINMPHFVVTGTEDIEWHVENMVFDFSEIRNSTHFSFPLTINSEYYHEDTGYYEEEYDPFPSSEPGVQNPLWKGFYLGQFQVVLPERITGTSEATITAQDLVIDHNGFTGEARAIATPLIQLGETNADGWGFGVNRFEFIMVASDLKMIYFDGKINVPLFGGEGDDGETVMNEENAFDYEAFIDIGNVYTFSANPSDDLEINCWKATAVIHPNSVLNLEYVQQDIETGEENNFKIFTEINAEISVQGDIGQNSSINIPPMGVSRMRIRNYKNPEYTTTDDPGLVFDEETNPNPLGAEDGSLRYFEIGDWTFPEEISANIGSFSIAFTDMDLFEEEEGGIPTSGLDFTVSASLDGDLAIEATGDFRITGTLDQSEDQHKWQATDFDISYLYVEASWAGANSVVGEIHIFKEEDYEGAEVNYGTGFRGMIQANFEGVGADIDVIAQFGSIQGDGSSEPYKYFMIDAMVEFHQGIPLGGIELKGLGGGMYRHMSRPDVDVAFAQLQNDSEDGTQVGAALSGVQYIPNPDVAFGFKASVILATPDPNVIPSDIVDNIPGDIVTDVSLSFVATLTFGMEFGATTNNPDGFGIRRIFLQGEGKFMSPINLENIPNFPTEVSAEDLAAMTELELDGSVGSGVLASEGAFGLDGEGPGEESLSDLLETEMSAYVLIDLNFYEDIYDARLKIFASALGGRLEGLVWASLHLNASGDGASDGSTPGEGDAPLTDSTGEFSEDGDWFVHVGTPMNRGYLSLSASPILDNAEFNAYFMIGNYGIPSELPPIELPDFEDLDPPTPPTNGNEGLVGSGAGLAFGAGFSMDTGEKNFLMFYGDFAVSLGFDFVLTSLFGPCDEDFDVGIDGWYAMGQAYAGLDADVGAQVKLFGIEQRFSVLSAELYALLRLELPNPIYGYAALDMDVEILNGLINVEPSFEFDFGTNIADLEIPDCQEPIIWEDVLMELDVIKEIRVPGAEDLTDVSVASSVEVEFFIPDLQLLEFYDEDDDIVQFRTNGTNYISVRDESGEIISAGTSHTDWTDGNRLATRWYNNFLPPNETLTVRSTVYFEQLMGYEDGEEVWEKVYQEGMENSSSEYWTELYVHEVLEYTFTTGAAPTTIPEENVVSAYPVRDQNYFLKDEYADGYVLKLQAAQNYLLQDGFTPGYTLQVTMRDNEDLQVGEAMDYFFFEAPEDHPNAFDGMYITIDKNPSLANEQDYKLELALIADGTEPEDPNFGQKHIVYELPFRTSQYNTFAEKINALNPIASCDINSTGETSDGNKLRTTYSNTEAFDDFELNGIHGEFAAMIRPEAVVDVYYCAGNEFCSGSQWLCDFEPTFRAIRHYETYECILWNEFFNPYESVYVTQNDFNEVTIHYEFADAAHDFVNLVWENMPSCSWEFPCDDYNFPSCPNPGGGNDPGTSSNGPANSIVFDGDNNDDFRVVAIEGGDDCSPAYKGYFFDNAPTYPTPLTEGTYDVNLKYHLPFSEGSIADFVPTSVSTVQLTKTPSTTDCSEVTSTQ